MKLKFFLLASLFKFGTLAAHSSGKAASSFQSSSFSSRNVVAAGFPTVRLARQNLAPIQTHTWSDPQLGLLLEL